ncbi:type IV secretion system DNA-binding domain-containing protein [Burkholderia cenocepacia]|uniref:type IV secretion system DNA-binding domain-containing protein n=1 Tax=Burkholderia cenocepacia TaxID=95486 RepID=UPI00076169EB|nr:type IV secretion system DNA-binding domain-containing protein [Burkholderia cenocepacia]KWU19182.1 hypothetical protein AS149_13115 [Burkholderia cenocepacia]
MDLVNQLFPAFAAGVSGAALQWMWRKVAARSGTWFPLLKRSAKLLLWGWALGSAAYAVYCVMTAADAKYALFAAVAGFCAPSVVRMVSERRAGAEDAEGGTRLASTKAVNRAIKALKKPARLQIGGVRTLVEMEPDHLLIAGSAGTEKSAVISSILDQLRDSGDTVIVVDSGGELLSRHCIEGTDFVLNPFDDRCVNWSPNFEMQGEWDAEALARSMIPDGVGENKEANGYAQTFASSVLRQLFAQHRLDLRTYLYYVQVASIAELKILLAGTPAMAHLSSDRTFDSVRTVASNYLSPYSYLPDSGTPFSVGEMVRAEHSGFLFVTYRDDQLDSMRSLIGCVLDVAARTILSLPPDPNRRVWLVIEDFPSIGRVQSLETMATKARKAGGCLLLGLQSVPQLRARYGELDSQTILSCLSSWLVLRCADADTADYLSKYMGDVQLPRPNKGSSASDSGEPQNQNERPLMQRAVPPAQIQSLSKHSGFLRLPGNLPVTEVKLAVPKKPRPARAEAFHDRDFKTRPMLKLATSVQTPLTAAVSRAPAAAAGHTTPAREPAKAPVQAAPGIGGDASAIGNRSGSFQLRKKGPVADEVPNNAHAGLTPSLIDEGSDLPADSKVLVTRGAAPLRAETPLRLATPLRTAPGTQVRKTLNNVTLS